VAVAEPPLSVLVVEDNPNDAMLIRRHLESADSAFLPDEIDLHHEETLTDGIDRLDTEPVDLLLLDLGLPESEGAETFERVRDRTTDVPVVVLTNLRDDETAVELLQRGAQDYLNKGDLSETELVKSVRYALERQRQKRELRQTTEQLEVLTRILRHDIRNDVQVVQGWSEKLATEVGPEHRSDLRKIIETSGHIRELTENTGKFLDVFTGEDDPETERVRVDRVLHEELEKADTTYTEATFETPEELSPATAQANELLSSVFRNLLNNAAQHGGNDPTVEIELTVREETVCVTIRDDGPGVPDDQKAEIFGKGEYGLASDGTGIGLYLVNTLVDGFGGDVRVEDRRNGSDGARFVVELPRA